MPAACHGQIGPAEQYTALAGYQSSTGHLWISVNQVYTWYVESPNNFTGAPPQLPAIPGAFTTDNDNRVGQSHFSNKFTYTDVDLGTVAVLGLTPGDFYLRAFISGGSPEVPGWIVSIPPTGAPRLDSVDPESASVGYNPLTGDLLVSANHLYSWQLLSIAALDADAAVFPLFDGYEGTGEPHRLASPQPPPGYPPYFADDHTYQNHDLGRIAPTGLALDNFTLTYKTYATGPDILGQVVLLVPEPATSTLFAVFAMASTPALRRSRKH